MIHGTVSQQVISPRIGLESVARSIPSHARADSDRYINFRLHRYIHMVLT